jgi:phospholipase/lecithinase/hemolysin
LASHETLPLGACRLESLSFGPATKGTQGVPRSKAATAAPSFTPLMIWMSTSKLVFKHNLRSRRRASLQRGVRTGIEPLETVANIKDQIAKLSAVGAKNFCVITIPDLALTPKVRALRGATILAQHNL